MQAQVALDGQQAVLERPRMRVLEGGREKAHLMASSDKRARLLWRPLVDMFAPDFGSLVGWWLTCSLELNSSTSSQPIKEA